jgi:SPP1 family phage portal protein
MDYKEIIEAIEKKKQHKYIARKYYYYKPSTQPEYTDFYHNEQIKTVKNDNTQEVYTNWFKVLVNQKIDYSLVKPVTVDKNIPEEFNIEDIVDKTSLNASLDSKSWLHTYINTMNRLDWIVVNDCQIVDIWDSYNKYIEYVVRFWDIEDKNNKDEKQKVTYVEIWTPEIVTSFKYKNDDSKTPFEIITKTHYMQVLKYQDQEVGNNPKSFGFIPFIPLYNNKNKESDIEAIHVLLDAYNEISTGFINNVRRFQEMIMKLKGYGGQDLEEFEKMLKKYKVIPVDENGDFDYLKVDIPVEARSVLLEICRKNIFIIGRGVDPTDDLGGSNITNVLIKSKYANLDMKNSDMEKQIRLFYKQLIYMLNTYYKLNLDDEITFNRTQIFNKSEEIDNCLKSMGLVSIETILKYHPFVEDVKVELKLLEKEKQENIDNFNQQLEQNKTIDFSNNNDKKKDNEVKNDRTTK